LSKIKNESENFQALKKGWPMASEQLLIEKS